MMRFIFSTMIFVSIFWVASVIVPVSIANAEFVDPLKTNCEGRAAASSVCQELKKKDNPFDGSQGIIPTIANFMAAVGGLLAVIVIILSGLRLIMSSGDAAKVTQSRNAIIYASAGIVVIVLARTIIGFIIDRI